MGLVGALFAMAFAWDMRAMLLSRYLRYENPWACTSSAVHCTAAPGAQCIVHCLARSVAVDVRPV